MVHIETSPNDAIHILHNHILMQASVILAKLGLFQQVRCNLAQFINYVHTKAEKVEWREEDEGPQREVEG